MKDLKEVFGAKGEDEEFTFAYLGTLRQNITEGERYISRNLILMTLLGAVFLLASQSKIEEVNLAFVKLSDPSYIQGVAPILVAALHTSLLNCMITMSTILQVHDKLLGLVRPQVYANDYERLLWPPFGAFGPVAVTPMLLSGRTSSYVMSLGIVRHLLYIIGPLVFIAFALYEVLLNADRIDYIFAGVAILIEIAALPLLAFMVKDTFTPPY